MTDLVVINGQNVSFEVVGDQTYTTSLNIAAVFEKRHDNIIAQIKRLPNDDFNALNFKVVEYKDAKGEMRKCYKITRDGFVMLAMGFTGDKAYRFKVEYINAFNKMEQMLKMNFNNRMSRSVMMPQLENKREQLEQVLKSENESLKDELINTQKELIRLYQMSKTTKDNNISSKKTARIDKETIKEIRKLYYEKGLTQKEVARLLGVGISSVYKYTRINEQGEFNE